MPTNKTNLQIIITKDLELKSKLVASKLGFNNVPEMVRSMLIGVTSPAVDVSPFVRLSPAKATRYDKMVEEAQLENHKGKSKQYYNAENLISEIKNGGDE